MTFSNPQWEPQTQREARRQEMFSFVEQWQQSGESQRSWCEMHGVQYAKFQYWVRKHRDAHTDDTSTFVDLLATAQPTKSICTLEIHFPSGIVVKLPSTDLETVRQLVG